MQAAINYSNLTPMQSNLLQFPGYAHTTTKQKKSEVLAKRPSTKCEVYPFKKSSDIKAMQTYFLTAYKTARSKVKAMQALRNWLWFTLGINIGFRGGDVCQLKWGQLLDQSYRPLPEYASFIQEQKTGKFRQIILNDNARQAIEFYFSQLTALHEPMPSLESYLFESGKGGKGYAVVSATDTEYHNLGNESFRRILKKAASECGITYNVGTHSLRKTFGYRYYKSYCLRKAQGEVTDVDGLVVLQWIFNHADSQTTLRYIGMDSEIAQAAYASLSDSYEMNASELNTYARVRI